MKTFWDERYRHAEYAYGTEANEFLKFCLTEYSLQGKMLFVAEGEGRNAVYAATQGNEVIAFDQSEAGKRKALQLAESKNCNISYLIADANNMPFEPDSFDAIVLIYAHFAPENRAQIHKNLLNYLKKGGYVVLEGFSKNNLVYREQNPGVGGPADEAMLFTTELIQNEFSKLSSLYLQEEIVKLNEGKYHIGTASVVRYVGKKI